MRGELIYRVAAGPPVGRVLLIEAIRHVRVSFAANRLDHRTRLEPAAIDPHRALVAVAESGGREATLERRKCADAPLCACRPAVSSLEAYQTPAHRARRTAK